MCLWEGVPTLGVGWEGGNTEGNAPDTPLPRCKCQGSKSILQAARPLSAAGPGRLNRIPLEHSQKTGWMHKPPPSNIRATRPLPPGPGQLQEVTQEAPPPPEPWGSGPLLQHPLGKKSPGGVRRPQGWREPRWRNETDGRAFSPCYSRQGSPGPRLPAPRPGGGHGGTGCASSGRGDNLSSERAIHLREATWSAALTCRLGGLQGWSSDKPPPTWPCSGAWAPRSSPPTPSPWPGKGNRGASSWETFSMNGPVPSSSLWSGGPSRRRAANRRQTCCSRPGKAPPSLQAGVPPPRDLLCPPPASGPCHPFKGKTADLNHKLNF